MSHALAIESQPVALELHSLLRDLDPARWDGAEGTMRGRIATLEERLARVLTSAGSTPGVARAPLRQRLGEIGDLLRNRVPRGERRAVTPTEAWNGFRKQLQQAYEALSISLRDWSVRVPSLRPTNHVRNVFHMCMGTGCVLLVEELLTRRALWIVPLVIASTAWFLEALRQYNARARTFLLWVFKTVAHPHERYRVNSSTWYVTALVLIALLFEPMVCAVAVVVLGLADPAAAIVGRRLGRIKLVNGRTLEGSAAFVLAGTLAATAVLAIWHSELSMGATLAIALGAAVPAAVAELYSRRVDDNFSIPLTAAVGAWGVIGLLGLG